MAMVSPGRMGVGVGWETISLIEVKELKRDFQAVDQSKEKDAPGATGPLSPNRNEGGRENDQSFHSAPFRLMDL